MVPDNQSPAPVAAPARDTDPSQMRGPMLAQDTDSLVERSVFRALMGGQGLRAGWSVLFFCCLYELFVRFLAAIAYLVYPAVASDNFLPSTAMVQELVPLLAILWAGVIMAHIEQRRIGDYHLRGLRPLAHFAGGLAAGFCALSALVGAMALGGWLHFGVAPAPNAETARSGAVWAITFLLTGLFEEGGFRCYALFTLHRGINFWWALPLVAGLCLYARLHTGLQGTDGVYAMAVLGLVPCAVLHWKKAEGSAFWQAAWATSTAFGYFHTGNNGESAMGVFAAAAIGFVFCVSVRVTGTAWWAIGCHAAWDWSETFFYGTPDSGLATARHLMTTTPAGSPFWSGGSVGPEGSLLIVPVILLLLAALLVLYGRKKPFALAPRAAL